MGRGTSEIEVCSSAGSVMGVAARTEEGTLWPFAQGDVSALVAAASLANRGKQDKNSL